MWVFYSLLTGEFSQKMILLSSDFFLGGAVGRRGWPKIKSVISPRVWGLWRWAGIDDKPVNSANLCEMLRLIHSYVEARKLSHIPWFSFALPIPITEVFFCLFVDVIFTSSLSDLYPERNGIFWDTRIHIIGIIRESSHIRFTEKFFCTQHLTMRQFYFLYNRIRRRHLTERNANDKSNHLFYKEPLINFKL